MRRHRTLTSIAAVLLLSTGGALAIPPPARAAAPGNALVSLDGATYTPGFERAVFENTPALTPLESERRSIWIRNTGPTDLEVRLSVRDVEISSDDLARSLIFTAVDADREASRALGVDELTRCTVVLPSRRIAAGSTLQVDFVIALRDVTGQTAQKESFRFALDAALQDAAGGRLPDDGCVDSGIDDDGIDIPVVGNGDITLATTGARDPSLVAIAGGALFAIGLLFLLTRRRRRADRP